MAWKRHAPRRRDLKLLLIQAEELLRLIASAWGQVPGSMRLPARKLADHIAKKLARM